MAEPTEDSFDPNDIIERFRLRAEAVRRRPLPPVEGEERRRFREQAALDYFDFALLADATATLEDGILTFTIDLRPRGEDANADDATGTA
jgi:hypothetical protein